MFLNLGQRKIDLSVPRVMGVINMTPDSFFDGSKYQTLDDALSVAVNMERDGAAIIDIGGESTRPKSQEIKINSAYRSEWSFCLDLYSQIG